MNLINEIKDVLTASDNYIKTNNFYYERHECTIAKSNIKVDLKYILKQDEDTQLVRVGSCPHCNTIFYHETFESKLL